MLAALNLLLFAPSCCLKIKLSEVNVCTSILTNHSWRIQNYPSDSGGSLWSCRTWVDHISRHWYFRFLFRRLAACDWWLLQLAPTDPRPALHTTWRCCHGNWLLFCELEGDTFCSSRGSPRIEIKATPHLTKARILVCRSVSCHQNANKIISS